MWDLAGKALDVPTYALFGGKVRDTLPVYANINRATNPRTPAGSPMPPGERSVTASARSRPRHGTVFLQLDLRRRRSRRRRRAGLRQPPRCGTPSAPVWRSCSIATASSTWSAPSASRNVSRHNLAWYEEPVAPENVDDTLAIKRRIKQKMAGGEVLFGMNGFAPLIERRAVDVIMPDVKHCGGLLELTRITAAAAARDVLVSPHNPSGPVSTAASVQAAAGAPNVNLLELRSGEVPWRSELLFTAGAVHRRGDSCLRSSWTRHRAERGDDTSQGNAGVKEAPRAGPFGPASPEARRPPAMSEEVRQACQYLPCRHAS